MECVGSFDVHSKSGAAHRNGEGVKESDLSENYVELRIPRLDEADFGGPLNECSTRGVVSMEAKSDRRELRLDHTSADSECESIGAVMLDPEVAHQPACRERVLAAAIDKRSCRKRLLGAQPNWHDRAKDRAASSWSFKFQVLEGSWRFRSAGHAR